MTTIHVTKRSDLDAIADQMRFTDGTQVERIDCGELTVLSSRVDDLGLWGHASDPETGVTVVLGGRVAFEEATWNRARNLPYDGGLACRLVLDAYLDNERDLYSTLNGGYGVLIHDPRFGRLHLITDRMGVFPFYRNIEGITTLSSHPDILADSLDQDVHLDEVTIAEVLGRAQSVYPYTYYEEIRQLPPSSHICFNTDLTVIDETEYWHPAFLDGELERDRDTLVAELAAAIKKAVQMRTHSVFDNPCVLLSGGIDSRSCLFGMDDPSKATTLTFTDSQPGSEFKIANQLAKAAGADHIKLVREQGHYVNSCQRSVEISAGMFDLADDHLLPFVDRINQLDPDVVLSGCYSDYLFKGLADNLEHTTLLGKQLPYKRIGGYEHTYYLDHYDMTDEYEERIEKRWQSRFEPAIRDDGSKAPYLAEDLRMRPMSCEADFAYRMIMWRTLPWDHLLSDKHILDVYGKIPIEIKKDKQFYEDVTLELMPPEVRDIVIADTGYPLGLSTTQKLLRRAKDRLLKSEDEKIGDGPPIRSVEELSVLFESEGSKFRREWLDSTSTEVALFESILGYDPWNRDFAAYDEDDKHLIYRILTIHTWLNQRDDLAEIRCVSPVE